MRRVFVVIYGTFFCFAPFVQADIAEDLSRHSLEEYHPFRSVLDTLFAHPKILDNENNLRKAGFTIIQLREPDFVIAKHFSLPGHLIKVHLHSSYRSPERRLTNLIKRCCAAEKLKNLIQKEGLCYFTVPDKRIYITPTEEKDPILLVTQMHLVSEKQSEQVWKHLVNKKVLKELYIILSNGLGSSKLSENVPYTAEGIFACIDTEKPSQGDLYVKRYLSKQMQDYWDSLVEENQGKNRLE